MTTGGARHDHADGHAHTHQPGLWAKVRHALVPHAHDAHDAIQTAEESTRDGIRTAWIGLAGMLVTAIVQIVIVAISGSIALLADTIHNLGHAATTIPLIMAFRLGRREPTQRYPFGFRRAEDLVGLFISAIIALTIVLILWESINALLDPRPLTNIWWVLAAGIVGFVGNEAVAVYRIRTGRRIGSAALIAGLLIAVAIAGILVNSLRLIVRRLMDGVEPEVIERLTVAAAGVDGVRSVGEVRARWLGHRMDGDAQITVDRALSVDEGHAIADRVEVALCAAVGNLDRVAVHVHAETADAVAAGPG